MVIGDYEKLNGLLNAPALKQFFHSAYKTAIDETGDVEPDRLQLQWALDDLALQEKLFSSLPEPFCITPEDVREKFSEHLPVEEADWEHGYRLFQTSIVDAANKSHQSEPLLMVEYGRSSYGDDDIRKILDSDDSRETRRVITELDQTHFNKSYVFSPEEPVWSPPDRELSLRIAGTISHGMNMRLLGVLEFGGSNRAFEALLGRVRKICLTANRTYSLLYLNFAAQKYGGFEEKDRQTWKNLLSRCLETLLYHRSSNSRQGTIYPRMRNALELLMVADTQENPAIVASLSVAAIDALLGIDIAGDWEPPIRKIDPRVAALLEPDSNMRPSAAEKVRTLYRLRNHVLHGIHIDGNAYSHAQDARLLAAGVLHSILEWVSNEIVEIAPRDVVSFLEKAYSENLQVKQVTPLKNVRGLWKKS